MKRLFLTALFLLSFASSLQAETLSLSTYYPSRFCVYNRLRLVLQPETCPFAGPPAYCNVNNDGMMWIEAATGRLWYCIGSAPRIVETVWQQVGNDIYPSDDTNPNIRVG